MNKSFDTAAAARNLKARHDAENAALRKRRGLARDFGCKTALILGKADSGVEKIIGFGSTFETWRDYRADSDLDLGIIGGNIEKLERLIPPGEFLVSLIDLDQQPERFRELALKNGVVLYEK